MLKGLGETESMIGMVIFVGGLLIAFGIIFGKLTYTSAIVKEGNDQIDLINMAHKAALCFSGGNNAIPIDRLTPEVKNSCDIKDVFICVKDLLDDKRWLDCGDVKDVQARVHVLLLSGSDLHVGDLSVKKI